MGRTKQKQVKFEQAVEQLEELIEQIESGDAGLEESLTHYEQGMKLIAHCREILSTAEKKIAELTLDEKGRLKSPDRDDEDEIRPHS